MINKTHVGLILIDKHGRIHDINLMAKNYFSLSDSMISNIKAWQLFEAGNPNSTSLQLLKNLEQHQELAGDHQRRNYGEAQRWQLLSGVVLY